MRWKLDCACVLNSVSDCVLVFAGVAHEFEWVVRARYLQKIHSLDIHYADHLYSRDEYSIHVPFQQQRLLHYFAFKRIFTVSVDLPCLQYVRTESQLQY